MNWLLELFTVIRSNDILVVFLAAGILLIAFAIIGNVPGVGPLGRRAPLLGLFGASLMLASVFFAMALVGAGGAPSRPQTGAPAAEAPPPTRIVGSASNPMPTAPPQPTRTAEAVAPPTASPPPPPATATPSPAQGSCPPSAQQAAAMFGGSAQLWRRLPGSEQYAWKYGPAPGAPIANLRIPAMMKADWWNDREALSRPGPAEVGYASEVTIWCAP